METVRLDPRMLPRRGAIARLCKWLHRSASAGRSASGGSRPNHIGTRRLYTAGGTTPAAVLVFLPDRVELGNVAARDPALWAAQGFDVVMPRQLWTDRLIADQQTAVARLLASAQALADAPIWLVGPSPTIEAVMPQLGPGQVSGVVVTSVTSNAVSCTRTMYYSNPGTGAEPKAVVKTSGDACGTIPSFGARQAPAGAVPVPQVKPKRATNYRGLDPDGGRPAQQALRAAPRRRDQKTGAGELTARLVGRGWSG